MHESVSRHVSESCDAEKSLCLLPCLGHEIGNQITSPFSYQTVVGSEMPLTRRTSHHNHK
jgi:hypothetical protein